MSSSLNYRRYPEAWTGRRAPAAGCGAALERRPERTPFAKHFRTGLLFQDNSSSLGKYCFLAKVELGYLPIVKGTETICTFRLETRFLFVCRLRNIGCACSAVSTLSYEYLE
ncbi:hypothetical protein EVAR_74646_1 [Eumeta japonica]|uniref:Uncharacterized protein n=1 Tax=Eumeta variegata TaxID=151549 RepID=A0A4C1WAR9_EUMVA|nr:hypothetical protein EVAR_74646_1 [Eumeta japonica]